MSVDQQYKEFRDFTDLTSDKVIREAAYPESEWLENGGGKGNGFLGGYLNSYSIVGTQDSPPEIRPTASGLLSTGIAEPVRQNLEKRAANIAQHWQKVQSHPCYTRFHSYTDNRLKYAVDTFEKKAKLKTAPDALKSDFALFRFYRLFADYIESYLIFDKYGHPQKYADAKVLDKASRHVKKLQDYFKNDGLKLNDFLAQLQLESHLKQLALEIDQAPRKDKQTPTAAKRRALEAFAYISLREFGEASATMLGYLAEILGWENPSSSKMDDIVATAKKKHQQATEKLKIEKTKKLAEALRQPPAIIAKN